NRRLTAGAQLPLADRMRWVAFELFRKPHPHDAGLADPLTADDFRVAFHHADEDAATGLTQRAHARLPFRDAGHVLLFGNEADDLVLGITAACERGARAGDGGQRDERSAIHF